ncbi:MAG TPA: transglycosylase SLT domain-containing protein [Polyangiaceae bacterium]|jgi:hypothetical protein
MNTERRHAAVAVGALVALGAILAALGTTARLRAWGAAFVSPLPTPPALSRDAGIAALPREVTLAGPESPELGALRAPDAGAPYLHPSRQSLFPADLPEAPSFQRPDGLARSWLGHEDERTDALLSYLAHDDRGHGALLAALGRSGRYRADVERILHAWKLPEEAVAVAFLESGFAPESAANDGGAGLWSIAPEVAAAYGLVVRSSFDERRGVAVGTEGAAHYLTDLRERFGSWELALYAFGAGYPAALADVSASEERDFWSLAPKLPQARVDYVRRVVALTIVLAHPERFGFEGARPDEPLQTSDLEVPAGTAFGMVARAAAIPATALRALNPEYLGETVPDTGFPMAVHLPTSALARAKEMLVPLLYAGAGSSLGRAPAPAASAEHADRGERAQSKPTARAGRFYYRVQEGDTLDSLAGRWRVAKEDIVLDNALDPTAGLSPGALLTIRSPSAGSALSTR